MPSTEPDPKDTLAIEVAAGVVFDAERRSVLLAKRLAGQHQGGYWEFPGGKLEAGESPVDALVRELEEEIGILALATEARCSIHHDYGDKRVLLHFIDVLEWQGEPEGREGQALRWSALSTLIEDDFPAANRPVVIELARAAQDG